MSVGPLQKEADIEGVDPAAGVRGPEPQQLIAATPARGEEAARGGADPHGETWSSRASSMLPRRRRESAYWPGMQVGRSSNNWMDTSMTRPA